MPGQGTFINCLSSVSPIEAGAKWLQLPLSAQSVSPPLLTNRRRPPGQRGRQREGTLPLGVQIFQQMVDLHT
jgi:hypothetical protein